MYMYRRADAVQTWTHPTVMHFEASFVVMVGDKGGHGHIYIVPRAPPRLRHSKGVVGSPPTTPWPDGGLATKPAGRGLSRRALVRRVGALSGDAPAGGGHSQPDRLLIEEVLEGEEEGGRQDALGNLGADA